MPLRGIPEEVWPEARRLLERWRARHPDLGDPIIKLGVGGIDVRLPDGSAPPGVASIINTLEALLGVPDDERYCQRCEARTDLLPDPGIEGFFFCRACWSERQKVSAAHEAGYDNDILEE
ncbi:MAG: hypothetical protein COX57_13680 [Alphaproteobacteria bacterium CG_4_10_14_0_2_um_filter_63_37]|nr:MAG: hypothetical protein AUJ55_01930 [Proteobacteria bacterium CG1_02_64_396]PJA23445.1 MAG: hypothetical protein COX57_13680 [Alphaproteobacteria bacterium CG_4_10_14_0_2_um_filter_63_37]